MIISAPSNDHTATFPAIVLVGTFVTVDEGRKATQMNPEDRVTICTAPKQRK